MADRAPALMPVLSRGKHRSPRRGACFMELASYLAGERWSDHPRCTHPLLAALARDVNDHVEDESRGALAPLIPEVIGLATDDPRADVLIAREAASAALPVAAAERQRVAAVGLLVCERELGLLGGTDELSARSRALLDSAPHARDWAQRFLTVSGSARFRRRSGGAIVHQAVQSISVACVPAPDRLLVDLLSRTIRLCQASFGRPTVTATNAEWELLHRLTHR